MSHRPKPVPRPIFCLRRVGRFFDWKTFSERLAVMPTRQIGLPFMVSNKGRVSDMSRFKYTPNPMRDQRRRFSIQHVITKRQHVIQLHRAVHILFNDPELEEYQPGDTVDHFDRNPLNNDASNLRWASKSLQAANRNVARSQYPEFRKRLFNLRTHIHVDCSESDEVLRITGFLPDTSIPIESVRRGWFFGNRCLFIGDWCMWTLDNSHHIEGEQWARVEGSQMSVSTLGRLQHDRLNNKKRYYPRMLEDGYYKVDICGKRIQMSHLVLTTFGCYPPFDGAQVDHIDRNPGNNAIDNLRWVTKEENNQNRKKSEGRQYRQIEVKLTTSNEWKRFASSGDASIEFGIDVKALGKVISPNERHKTAPGKDGLRYHVRLAHDPTQDDLPGEEWKEINFDDWAEGGKYYGI